MKLLLLLGVSSLLVLGCKDEDKPAPVGREQAEQLQQLRPNEPQQAQAQTQIDESPAIAPDPTPAANGTDDDSLVDALLNDASLVGYSPTHKIAVYPRVYSDAELGSGLEIVFASDDGTEESLEVYGLGDDPRVAIAANRDELARRIANRGFIPLASVNWPDDETMIALPDRMERLAWSNGALSVVSKHKSTLAAKPRLENGYEITPERVYTAVGQDIVIVRYAVTPPNDGTEGLSGFTRTTVLRLK